MRILGTKSIVLIGLMGCGKSSIGRRLATRIDLPFLDSDEEIEKAAGKTILEIFSDHGEAYFRDRERLIVGRLLQHGPQVLATGGGAFICPQIREAIFKRGISIWLKAELKVLMERVSRRENRPLLSTGDPGETMRRLMVDRYPIYSLAEITVESKAGIVEDVVDYIICRLEDYVTKVTDF